MEKYDFTTNVRAKADILDLIQIGWDFYIDEPNESASKYHVEIFVDKKGNTSWCFVNTEKEVNGIWEGSDEEPTGDDEQTHADLESLEAQGKLWSKEQNWML